MILTLVNNLFVVLTLHIYNSTVLGRKDIKWIKLVIGWLLAALIFSTQVLFQNAHINYNMASFLIPFCIMTLWGYEGSAKRKIFYVAIYYFFAMFLDVVIYIVENTFMSAEQIVQLNSTSSFTLIYNILVWLFVRILSMVVSDNNIKQDIKPSEWFEVIFVPVGSIVIILLCFGYQYRDNMVYNMISMIIILFFNVISYVTYMKMEERVELQYRAGLLENQNQCYINETKRITGIWNKISEFEHNYKYQFSELMNDRNFVENVLRGFSKNVANSGNFVIDAIINNRATLSESEGIQFDVNLRIPRDVKYIENDISVLLCNLLDNAIEANLNNKKEKWVSIAISTDIRNDSTLLIDIKNPYEGKLNKNRKGEYITSKVDSTCHGIGIQSIKNIVKRHNGETIINDENNIFSIKIIAFDMLETTKST